MSEERTHFVYTVYDADGVVLYVGCTGHPEDRYRAHMRGADDARGWFDYFIARWRVSGPYPRRKAFELERERIHALQPVWNGHSKANANGRRALINAYLAEHGFRFAMDHSGRNRLVPARTRKRGSLELVRGESA